MDNLNAIKKRIKSVDDISQMTSAMQLVSSAKMRRSVQLRQSMTPFFALCTESMQEIRNRAGEINNPFYELKQKVEGETWKIGYFVLSGEQGLAGAYNNNMVKITEEHVHSKILENTRKNISTEYRLYVFGKPAREKLIRSGYNVDRDFSFPIAEPTFYQARNLSSIIKSKFLSGELDLVYLLYTNNKPGKGMVPVALRLLPVDLKAVNYLVAEGVEDAGIAMERGVDLLEYSPNANAVFDYLIDTYLNAVLYGAMVEAYQSEQTARLTAMQNANDNAGEMLKKLTLMSNRARQAKITTELTEIVNGAEQVNNNN
ncbi:F-type H+-transporting ATPase subunit gamma [Ruminococcaceae bacterium YRB3002]|nr:F-type H+-transporting ATPase subunit gamma [Ruminococcaceae bacterium YRB3002]